MKPSRQRDQRARAEHLGGRLVRLVLATRNANKVCEFRALLADLPLQLESLLDHPEVGAPPETGTTYLANALSKATAAARACGAPALADDSGLEVAALGGEPGIRSARYASAEERENIALLLDRLRGVPAEKRRARFRCVLVVARPDGATLSASGTCEGFIAEAPRGSGGFGYDPVFVDPTTGLTFAEIPPERKNEISHRARACEALRPHLLDFLRN